MSALTPAPHAVYWMYGQAGQLLYIGCTANPIKRITLEHQYQRTWYQDLARVDLQWYPSLEPALAAEAAAITANQPLHNRRYMDPPVLICPRCKGEKAAGPSYCKPCKRAFNKEYYRQKKEAEKHLISA